MGGILHFLKGGAMSRLLKRGPVPGVLRKSAVGLLSAALLGSVIGTAVAYPRGGLSGDCGGTTVYFRFVDSSAGNWTAARKDAVRAGFNQWENVVNSTGTKRAKLTEVSQAQSSGINITVKFANLPGLYGQATCSTVEFHSGYKDNTGILRATAAHEVGHVLKLGHSHKNDSPAIPTMATCLANSDQHVKGTIESDDHAALMQKKGSVNTFQGNESFENGLQFWSKTDTTWWEVLNSPSPAAPYGSKVLRFRRSAGGPADDKGVVKQNVRLSKVGSFNGAAYIRKGGSAVSGRVIISTPWKPVAFKVNDECPVVQQVAAGDWMAGQSVSVAPTTSYAQYSTNNVNPACGTQLNCQGGSMGAEVTIKIRNALTDSTSEPPPAFVDVVRARGV